MAQVPIVTNAVIDSNYELRSVLGAAEGQLVTLIAHGVGGSKKMQASGGVDLPTSIGGVKASLQSFRVLPFSIPIFEVEPFATNSGAIVAMVTVQIPFFAFDLGGGAVLKITDVNSTTVNAISIDIFGDRAHILTQCDPFIAGPGAPLRIGFMGCQPHVTHADGSLVWAKNPAQAGEELVAYAVGLGQTTPPLETGKPATIAAPTNTRYTLDFNYRPNALATRPAPGAPQPLFAGATPGYVGLYQVNFVVPPPLPGTPPCVDINGTATPPPGTNVVETNLTVTIAGQYSFDAAGICVAVP